MAGFQVSINGRFWVSTEEAPAFYAKHGFEVVAVVDDHPDGHKNMLLRKRLDAAR